MKKKYKCLLCNGTNTIANKIAKAAQTEFNLACFQWYKPLKEDEKTGVITARTDKPMAMSIIDICTDCGNVYATKIEISK